MLHCLSSEPGMKTEQPLASDERFRALVRAQTPLLNICRAIGVSSQRYVRREIAKVCAQENIVYTPTGGGKGCHVIPFTPEADNETYRFRHNLAEWLDAYAKAWPVELSIPQMVRTTGLTTRALGRLRLRPHREDVTLTQLHRIATVIGVPFADLLVSCSTRQGMSLPNVDVANATHPDAL